MINLKEKLKELEYLYIDELLKLKKINITAYYYINNLTEEEKSKIMTNIKIMDDYIMDEFVDFDLSSKRRFKTIKQQRAHIRKFGRLEEQ